MDLLESLLLSSAQFSETQFIDYLNKQVEQIEKSRKTYSHIMNRFEYKEKSQSIPNSLFKFLSIDGCISSLKNMTLKFSHPLSFRNLSNNLCDNTELWFERFFIDLKSIEQFKDTLNRQGLDDYAARGTQFLFTYLLYHHIGVLLESNKILCLSDKLNNDYLWNTCKMDTCIEYDSELFFQKSNLNFNTDQKFTLLYNKVQYVEKLEQYPIRYDDYSWLSNLLFIKNIEPYSAEEEFRILFTEQTSLDKIIEDRSELIKIAGSRLLGYSEGNSYQNHYFPTLDKSFIRKVYLSKSALENKDLINLVQKLEIPFETVFI